MFDQTGMELMRLRAEWRAKEKARGRGKPNLLKIDWHTFADTFERYGIAEAVETLPEKVRGWWIMHESGTGHIEIARETGSNRSTVGKVIRKIKRGGHGY